MAAPVFNGNVVGNVTGNLTGNVSGSLSGGAVLSQILQNLAPNSEFQICSALAGVTKVNSQGTGTQSSYSGTANSVTPAAPTLSAVAGTSSGGTVYVVNTLVYPELETITSAQSSQAITTAQQAQTASPAADPAGKATGYNTYASATSGGPYYKQNPSPTAIGTAFTIPGTLLTATAPPNISKCALYGITGLGQLIVGDAILLSTATPSALKTCGMRILALPTSPNTAVVVRVPNGASITTSGAWSGTPLMAGDLTGAAGGAGPDGWSKSATLLCGRTNWSGHITGGARWGMWIQKGSNSTESFYVQVDTRKINSFAGRTCAFGAWVKQISGTPGQALLAVNDGAGDGTHSGSVAALGTWYWLEATKTIGASPSQVQYRLDLPGATGDQYVLCCPMFVYGVIIGQGNWAPIPGERLVPVVKMSPPSYVGATVTFPVAGDSDGYPVQFDVFAETNTQIAYDVIAVTAALEAAKNSPAPPSNGSAIYTKSNLSAPTLYDGPRLWVSALSERTSGNGVANLNTTGNATDTGTWFIYSSGPADQWGGMSFDLGAIFLR